MTRLLPSSIQVKYLNSNIPASNFNSEKIEQAAKLIIQAEGIISPLVVARTGINSFKVIYGHFEYYAAVRAKEIDLARGEMISAYIMDKKNAAILKQQINLFRDK